MRSYTKFYLRAILAILLILFAPTWFAHLGAWWGGFLEDNKIIDQSSIFFTPVLFIPILAPLLALFFLIIRPVLRDRYNMYSQFTGGLDESRPKKEN
jgi:hypothetical protein